MTPPASPAASAATTRAPAAFPPPSVRTLFPILLGLLATVPAAFLAGLLALVAGVHLAEARGISNYAGERAAWSLLYIALPTALAAGVVAYLLTRWTIA